MTWLVTVDYRSRTPQEQLDIDDDRLGICAELLSEHMGEVSTDGLYYSVAVMVEAATPGAALDVAADLIGPALSRAQLPSWPRVRAEQISEEEVRRSRVE